MSDSPPARAGRAPRLLLVLGTALLPSIPLPGSAQEDGSVGVLGGLAQYDLSGTGTVPVTSFRLTSGLDRLLVAEGAVAYLSYASQGEEQVNHVFPELQLQIQWPRPTVRPYLGAGVGGSRAWSGDRSNTDLTLSVAGGVRWPVVSGWALQGELRLRSIDPFAGTTADWGLGVAGRF